MGLFSCLCAPWQLSLGFLQPLVLGESPCLLAVPFGSQGLGINPRDPAFA